MKTKSELSMLFGCNPPIKVLRILIDNYPLDYSKTQLCEVSGIQYITMRKFWGNWEKSGILKKRFRNRYSLNKENKIVKLIFQIDKYLKVR